MPTGPLTSQTQGVTSPLWNGDTGICFRRCLRITGNPRRHEVRGQLVAIAVKKVREVHFFPFEAKDLFMRQLEEDKGGACAIPASQLGPQE